MIDDILDVPASRTKWASIISLWKGVYAERLADMGYPKFRFPIYITELPPDVSGMSATKDRQVIWLNELHLECDAMIGIDRMITEVLPHEMAHAYVNRYHPDEDQMSHGSTWQALCLMMGLPPDPRIRPNRGWKKALALAN